MIQKSFLEKIKLYEWLVEKSHSSDDLNKKCRNHRCFAQLEFGFYKLVVN